MPERPTVLGIDLGTSSVKVVLADPAGTILRQNSQPYPVVRDRPGWAETDPERWWSAIVAAVHAVLADPTHPAPAGIGLSGQMHGVVLAAADGAPVRPAVLWADTRAGAELDLYRALAPDTASRLANPLSPGMAGPILAWLARNEPDAVARASAALQPKDWVRARLTGGLHGEPSDASATLLYDVLAEDWHGDVLAALGIAPRLLPDLLPSAASVAGTLLAEPARQLGLPAGIPVAAGAADTAAAALGSGLVEVGAAQLTIGTGVQVVTVLPAPSLGQLRPIEQTVTHLYRDATSRGWYAMAAGLTGGTTLEWVCRTMGVSWAELYASAGHPPESDDPIFLPHLMGERTPYLDPAMRGGWLFLDARHSRESLLYAALEGVAFAVADCVDALPDAAVGARELRLAGGGTTSPAFRQLLADVLQSRLVPMEVAGASARGAALLGAAAAGLVDGSAGAGASAALGSAVVPRPDPLRADRRRRYRLALHALRRLAVPDPAEDG